MTQLFANYEAATRAPEIEPPSGEAALKSHIDLPELKVRDLSPDGVKFLGSLAPIAQARSIASNIASKCDRARNRMMRTMAACAFIAALSFHGFSHWHIAHKAACPQHSGSADTDHADHGGLSLESMESWFSVSFLLLTLSAIGCAIINYRRYQESNQEWLRFDARALAEGLRVQFYWAAAGIHASVAARYMFRQKGELDWIRNAISSLSFPYHRWKDQFESLCQKDRDLILKQIQTSWMEAQSNYFNETAAPKSETLLHRFHTLGWGLTFAGILQPLLLLGFKLVSHPDPCPWIALAALIFLVSGFSAALWRWIQKRIDDGESPAPKHHSAWKDPNRFLRWLDRALQFRRLPVALLMSGLVLLIVRFAPGWADWIPANKDLWIILTGALLVGGAILIAWGEKLSLSEHHRQYEAMGHLFLNSNSRANDLLDGKVTQEELPLDPIDPVEGFRDLLLDLGKEALDENAEWLLLHRSRPLEPFLAG